MDLSVTTLKMATTQGYKFGFLDTVPDDLFCKKCALVARKLIVVERATTTPASLKSWIKQEFALLVEMTTSLYFNTAKAKRK